MSTVAAILGVSAPQYTADYDPNVKHVRARRSLVYDQPASCGTSDSIESIVLTREDRTVGKLVLHYPKHLSQMTIQT